MGFGIEIKSVEELRSDGKPKVSLTWDPPGSQLLRNWF